MLKSTILSGNDNFAKRNKLKWFTNKQITLLQRKTEDIKQKVAKYKLHQKKNWSRRSDIKLYSANQFLLFSQHIYTYCEFPERRQNGFLCSLEYITYQRVLTHLPSVSQNYYFILLSYLFVIGISVLFVFPFEACLLDPHSGILLKLVPVNDTDIDSS